MLQLRFTLIGVFAELIDQMSPATSVALGVFLPVELFENIIECAWLSRRLDSFIGISDHYALYNTLSLVSHEVRLVIVRVAWIYVFISSKHDIFRYHHLHHGSAAALVDGIGYHCEVHMDKEWLLSIDALVNRMQLALVSSFGNKRSVKEAFIRILKSSSTPSTEGVVSICNGNPEIHIWNGEVDDSVKLHTYDSVAAQKLKYLWLHNALASSPYHSPGTLDWQAESRPCQEVVHLRVFMNTGSHAIWESSTPITPTFKFIYPHLRILELTHSTSLVGIMPLLPRTLKTLILNVPINVLGAPRGTVYSWSLPRCFRECACLRKDWKPTITLRTGKEEPSGWSELLAAANMVSVKLERVIAFF
jgi:hypothetical protein